VVGERELKATSTNISEGGIAILLHQALPKNATPRAQFTLPDTSISIDAECEVAWMDLKGFAGLSFRNMEKTTQEVLEGWLAQQGAPPMPGIKR
jgi:c-di-GMP-binding flagellar brake protein YcgR